ncbi:MAG: hypothetical protein COW00_10710 [Bdellovibrio sp. CG12_big_fil_rev_8_21_14_0_65_39_13]|nr:MAG: hypothetical protein COW78_13665 [Bdellovibrio sp. CG22_combo_CG10-13_8_21_14_all_39_27]PIQ59419.1 MAG: hypothetical protein COW00_10710 [Bdellovibrio sp. CG12_big_fil_rev_8_21_14_0_65_39_13]PIR34925.1 MAG: hypothetical protein COV37_11735 [Bdellovibrio sp. CG11_big_fil_rev_8_21_14_0_20_39_38]
MLDSNNVNIERSKILPFIALISAVAFFTWTFNYYYFFQAYIAGQICFISGVLSLISFVWTYKWPSLFATHIFTLNIWLNLVISGFYGGGFSSSAMQHLVLFPLGAFIIFNRRQAFVWSFLALIGLLYFSGLSYFNIPLPHNLTHSQWNLMYRITFFSIFSVTGIVIFILKKTEEKHDDIYFDALRINIDLEKKNQLGQMAGQIAHEINNPLAIIKGHISNLKRKFMNVESEGSEFDRYIVPVERNIDRIEKVVRSLKYMSRDSSNDPIAKVKVDEILEEALILCSEKFRLENIKLELEDNDDIRSLQIETRRVLISQVLLALLDNSFDEVVNLENRVITIKLIKDNKLIKIQVVDSGLGIDLKSKDEVFNAFYSTKSKDIHIGLGLAQAKDLILKSNGNLKFIGNNPTTFEIAIPLNNEI